MPKAHMPYLVLQLRCNDRVVKISQERLGKARANILGECCIFLPKSIIFITVSGFRPVA